MEISGSANSIASMATAMSESKVHNEMSTKMLKKGLDAQASAAAGLLKSVDEQAPAAAPSSGGHGQMVDVMA